MQHSVMRNPIGSSESTVLILFNCLYDSLPSHYLIHRSEAFICICRLLEEDAQVDADLAALLQGANGNPEEVQRRMRQEMDSLHEHIMTTGGSGSAAPMKVFMRPHDPFSLWIWIQLFAPPSPSEEEMIQEVLGSWFLLGRLGGFDSSNLQTMYSDLIDGAEVEYEVQEGLAATMHDLGEIETNGNWVRVK